jgi:hypothetical protein
MVPQNTGPTWPRSSEHDELPVPGGKIGDTSTEKLRAFFGHVKDAAVLNHPGSPMCRYDHTIGREAACALYRQHLEKHVDGPAVADARVTWLTNFRAP